VWGTETLDTRTVVVLIPALNEEETIASVVRASLQVGRVTSVVVVDNNSSDRTASLASTIGACVVSCAEIGKAQAVKAGLRAIEEMSSSREATGVVLLDGDLRGLRPHHIDALIDPLGEDSNEMVCGHLAKTRARHFFLPIPMHVLTGQRAVTFEALNRVDWEKSKGYFLEVELSRAVPRTNTRRLILDGVTHTRREHRKDDAWIGSSRLPASVAGPWIRLRVAIAFSRFTVAAALGRLTTSRSDHCSFTQSTHLDSEADNSAATRVQSDINRLPRNSTKHS
jgi:glycosyltransferase involved in cell wall biosynthesis